MPLHKWIEDTINDLRYKKVKPYVKPCKKLADLGCRRNYAFLKRVRRLAEQCWGLDIDMTETKDGNITLLRRDITKKLPFQDSELDQISCLAVLEHIENPRPILDESFRCLKPGGDIILTTPTKMGIFVHDLLIKTGLVRDVEPDEHKDFDMSTQVLTDWVKSAGFEISEAHTFEFGMNLFVRGRKP